MEQLKIAIALDKNGNIAKTHFGDADFIQYAIISEELELLDKKENILKTFNEDKHGHDGKMKFASEVLKDVKIVVSGSMSPNFKRLKNKAGLYPIVSKKGLNDTLNHIELNINEIIEFFKEEENLVYFID